MVIHEGKSLDKRFQKAFEDFQMETVVMKSGNAIDREGNISAIASGFDGDTIAHTIGTVTSAGLNYIFLIGWERLIPSVSEVLQYVGAKTFDYSLGENFHMFCIVNGKLITENDLASSQEVDRDNNGGVDGKKWREGLHANQSL